MQQKVYVVFGIALIVVVSAWCLLCACRGSGHAGRSIMLLRQLDLPADCCYVITLDTAEGRARMARLRNTMFGPYLHVVPGVFGKALDVEHLEQAGTIQRSYRNHDGTVQTMSSSEMGCLLSHVKVWQTLVDSEHETALVLEDDAFHFDPQFGDKVSEALRHTPSDWGIFLCGFWIKHDHAPGTAVNAHVVRVQDFVLAHCYMIRKWAARALIGTRPYNMPSDSLMAHHSASVPIYRHRHTSRAMWDKDPQRERYGIVSNLSTQQFDKSHIEHAF